VISDDPAQRFRAYAASHIRIDHPTLGQLQVEPDAEGDTHGAFPLDDAVTVHVVTAHNPGKHLTDAKNLERHERLAVWLAHRPELICWPAAGGDAQWHHTEVSVAITGLSDDDAKALGREFDQEAVFAWRSMSLDVLACDSAVVVSSGWRLRVRE
jgi:hypothetical protein